MAKAKKAKAKKRAPVRKKSSKPGRERAKFLPKKAAKQATQKKASSEGRPAGVSAAKPEARLTTKITYQVVEHDGGWAYRVDGVFSEAFPSHDEARIAAERAAREQILPGDTTTISWEDKDGRWHDEMSAGDDRPQTDVEG
jgi:hypothetical protein